MNSKFLAFLAAVSVSMGAMAQTNSPATSPTSPTATQSTAQPTSATTGSQPVAGTLTPTQRNNTNTLPLEQPRGGLNNQNTQNNLNNNNLNNNLNNSLNNNLNNNTNRSNQVNCVNTINSSDATRTVPNRNDTAPNVACNNNGTQPGQVRP